MSKINFVLGFEALTSYKRLSYKSWYALAEFIDNSTQAYLNNKAILDPIYAAKNTKLKVDISYNNVGSAAFIEIKDNSIGMDDVELQSALNVGKKPAISTGRSKYGMGMKTAAFWFGDTWELTTKKYGNDYEFTIKVDLQALLQPVSDAPVKTAPEETDSGSRTPNTFDLRVQSVKADQNAHYTHLRITNLNQKIEARTAGKIKDYLRSIYRRDLEQGSLGINFQGSSLTWNSQEIVDMIRKDEYGVPFKRNFAFEVNGKTVTGWAGILAIGYGSRGKAGFSIFQANRAIKGWPESYRPESLFGEQDGGRNDLVNQRLFGEMNLDGFTVSHTKDEIIFEGDQEVILNEKIGNLLADYKKMANTREFITDSDIGLEVQYDFQEIVHGIFEKINMNKPRALLLNKSVLSPAIIKESFNEFYERVISQDAYNTFGATIGSLHVKVVINSDSSLFDPYLLTRSTASETNVTVIINQNHPHWRDITNSDLATSFIKHCIYDGLAEWKAWYHAGDLDPDTIKMMKDTFLREILVMDQS